MSIEGNCTASLDSRLLGFRIGYANVSPDFSLIAALIVNGLHHHFNTFSFTTETVTLKLETGRAPKFRQTPEASHTVHGTKSDECSGCASEIYRPFGSTLFSNAAWHGNIYISSNNSKWSKKCILTFSRKYLQLPYILQSTIEVRNQQLRVHRRRQEDTCNEF